MAGAGNGTRRSTAAQRRENGVKTVRGRPSAVCTSSGSATRSPLFRWNDRPAAMSASPAARSRARAKGLTSRVANTSEAAASAARAGMTILRLPGTDDQRGAAGGELLGELAQRLEEEPRPVRRSARAVEEPRIQHEDRHDTSARAERRGQRRVVVEAQVAPKPEQGNAGRRAAGGEGSVGGGCDHVRGSSGGAMRMGVRRVTAVWMGRPSGDEPQVRMVNEVAMSAIACA